ncbi:MAG: hypothetical protein QM493_06610 [Sulfurovum sp.]
MRVSKGLETAPIYERTIYCEGRENSADKLFYTTLLGGNSNFDLKPLGSSNTLLCFAREEHLISPNDFCLIDRDFRTDEEVLQLEEKYKIKFLPVHEIETLLLNPYYLQKLSYIRPHIKAEDIQGEIDKIIELKKVRFLADFLQFKINTHLDVFPRIRKLKNNELPQEEALVDLLLLKLENNYNTVESKVIEIKENYILQWKVEYNTLELKYLPAKEIFKALKDKIFINFPQDETQIVKDISLLMEADGFMPPELIEIFG